MSILFISFLVNPIVFRYLCIVKLFGQGVDMALVSMKQAAVMAGIGRTTLYRKVDKGIVSLTEMPDGSKKVDTSELFRVFPKTVPNEPEKVLVAHEGHGVDTLKKELEHLKEIRNIESQKYEGIIQAKDQLIEAQAKALRLLEHKSEPAERPSWIVRVLTHKVW